MDKMTQQNAAMVEETNAATKNLNHEARQLAATFAAFRIGDEHGAPGTGQADWQAQHALTAPTGARRAA